MHTKQDWIRQICERPDDDTLRMVYADWLEESGDAERAEFIRLQVSNQHQPLTERGKRLLIENLQWSDPLWKTFNINPCIWSISEWEDSHGRDLSLYWRYSRGFVHKLVVPSYTFMKYYQTLFQEHPIQEVMLTNCKPIQHDNLFFWEVYGSDWAGDFLIPKELFTLLPAITPNSWWWAATSEQYAQKCLSDACVELGRQRAGLPSLHQPSTTGSSKGA